VPEKNDKAGHFGVPWLTFVVLITSLGAAFLVWYLVSASERAHLRRVAGLVAKVVRDDLAADVDNLVLAQVSLAKLWEFAEPSHTEWEAAAELFIQQYPGCAAIEWLDPQYQEHWQTRAPGKEAWQPPPATRELRERLLKAALQSRSTVLSPTFLSPRGERLRWAVVPVYRQERFLGFVLVSFEAKRSLENMLRDVRDYGFAIAVSEEGQETYRSGDGSDESQTKWGGTTDLALPGVSWQVRVWPNPDALNAMRTRLPDAALLTGTLLALLLTLTVHFAQRAAARSDFLQQSNEKLETEISERRRAEEALKASQARFAGIMKISADAVISTNESQRITLFNQGAEKVFGYSPNEVLGQPIDILIPERLREAHRRHVAAFLQSDQQTLRMSSRNYLLGLRKDGSEFRMESTVSKLEIAGERIFTVILRDMTDWVRAAEDLRSARDEMEARVRERTAELEQANQALLAEIAERRLAEESLRELSGRLLRLQDEERRRLVRELHDGATQNLVALSMNLSALRQTVPPASNALNAFAECLKLVDESLEELRTISFILHPPLLETMGLSCALPNYVKGFSERSGILVNLDMPADLGRLGRDVELTLYRIVQEALSNVRRHSRSRTAEITLSPELDSVALEVADQGCGLPPSPDGHRLGVGIAGMRERVRLLGGSLELKSGNPGTTLRVVLPVVAAGSPSSSLDAADLPELA
jgi:PAS domain S-box-containing protein